MILKVTGNVDELIIQQIEHSDHSIIQLDISRKKGFTSLEIGRLYRSQTDGKQIEFINAEKSVLVQWRMLKLDQLFSISGVAERD
jgi:hypothetical protein